jgi:oligoendopeptidase F
MRRTTSFLLAAALAAGLPAVAQEQRERSQVPEKYRWNLAELYPTEQAWRDAKDKLVASLPSLAAYRGKLGTSAGALRAGLDAVKATEKELSRLYVYAAMRADEDTRDTRAQAMRQEMAQVATQFSAGVSFVEPEILKMDRAQVVAWQKAEPGLAPYRQLLRDVLRRQAHTGTEGEERILSLAGIVGESAGNIYGIFKDADFPYPTVTLEGGKQVRLDASAYPAARASKNREDRQKVFEAFFGAIGKFSGTFGAQLDGAVQRDVFYARARKYDSALQAALDANDIPVAVYHSLVDGVNANLPALHRYLRLRQRILGVDQLRYHDLYAPLVASVDKTYTVEEARQLIQQGMQPLGADYVQVLGRAFDERWLDLMPSTGKRPGAYSQGAAYDVHPYMLLNFNGQYLDVTTLAHELGHTMQSYFSNQAQPYPTADYPIFVAEVASTFNEALLIESVLKNTRDDATRLSILGEYLEGLRQTVFRQTQFAEFELRAHEMAEKGQPLTGEAFDQLYLGITRKYYGHDQKVCLVGDEIAHEWAYIPHFYRGFYVYQYATSFTASTALSQKVLSGEPGAVKRYRDFLAAGGSKYPIELLKEAGVDMTTREPLDLTVKKMNAVMDEIEKILDRQKVAAPSK